MSGFSSDELIEAEQEYAGQICLILVTGNHAQLAVCGEEWEFDYDKGRILIARRGTRRLPRALYRLASHRAEEAMRACFAGYKRNQGAFVSKKNKQAPLQRELALARH